MVATFGDWLRIKINDAGLNVAEVARRAGMTRQNLGRIVNNAPHWQTGTLPRVKIETVDKIAKAIGVDIDEARLAAGYAPTNAIRKPQTIPELIAALEAMGIEPPQLYGGYTQDPDGEGFKEIVERIWLDIQLVTNRLSKDK